MSDGLQPPTGETAMATSQGDNPPREPSVTAEYSVSSRNSPEAPPLLRSRSRTSLGKRTRDVSEASSNKRRRSSTDDTEAALISTKFAKLSEQSDANPSTTTLDISPANTTSQSQSADAPGSSPYGTRSRNRGGASRPNYAEDDIDVETPATRKSAREPKTSSSATDADTKSTSNVARRSTGGGGASATIRSTQVAGSNAPAQNVPGTSSFAVIDEGGSELQTSVLHRKRKATSTQTSSSAATPASSTRKQASANANAVGRDISMVTFQNCGGYLSRGVLVADDKTRYQANDWIYLVCEPPGEPYYLARIMDFLHKDNDPNGPVDALRVNSIYRPRDILRKATDSRLVFASMQSETCPVTSLRGKCRIEHKSRIADLDAYRRQKDSFYFSQLYERFMHRYYDVIPREKITNISAPLKKIIDDQWEFIISEPIKTKELTSASKTCRVCAEYCANNESVDCAVCKNTYHMNCVDPPLAKKPARGFAWSCGPCSRKQERRLEARNTPLVGEDGEDEEMLDDEDGHRRAPTSQVKTEGSTPEKEQPQKHVVTKEQMAEVRQWLWRYLGVHSKNDDLRDFDDRIYPRASSRIGPRHQATVPTWHGHPVQYVKPDAKKRQAKNTSNKKDSKVPKEILAQIESEKQSREKTPWIVDKPHGYVERGEDYPNDHPLCTAKKICCLTKIDEPAESQDRTKSVLEKDEAHPNGDGDSSHADAIIDTRRRAMAEFMEKIKPAAEKSFHVKPYNTEFLDKAVSLMQQNDFDVQVSADKLKSTTNLKIAKLEGNDLKKFEEAFHKYGNNLMDITRYVKTRRFGEIVRFYYTWKKTDDGERIWGNFRDRKATKAVKREEVSTQVDDIADDFDDSAYDSGKAVSKKKSFECKFCQTKESRIWRRAPLQGSSGPDAPARTGKSSQFTMALCTRCALLWRKYATMYENIEEVAKKTSQTGGRAFKRKENEDTFVEMLNAHIEASTPIGPAALAAAQALGLSVPAQLAAPPELENSRKKPKLAGEKDTPVATPPPATEQPKKKPPPAPEKPPEPALIPEQPKLRALPCAVCQTFGADGEEILNCKHCKLAVHRSCYGIPVTRQASKWACDTCTNDTIGQCSTKYKCILCPNRDHLTELWEPPKPSHKKKTEREREKERLEKEMLADAKDDYARKQTEMGRPQMPRAPLKPTSGNNWVHVTCAIWVSQMRFPDPTTFDKAEGFNSLPQAKFNQVCKVCSKKDGVCVTCHKCPNTFHVSCAQQQEYLMGFDVTPVKSSRRDAVDSITLGTDKGAEKGFVEAVIYCPEHAPKSILHPMNEATTEPGVTALQLFARHFKQADNSLTGTVRKASLITASSKPGAHTTMAHRPSITSSSKPAELSQAVVKLDETDEQGDRVFRLESASPTPSSTKRCCRCDTTTSPKFYKAQNGYMFEYQRGRDPAEPQFLCHRCSKRTADYTEKMRARKENPDLSAAQLYPKIKFPSKGHIPAPYTPTYEPPPQPVPITNGIGAAMPRPPPSKQQSPIVSSYAVPPPSRHPSMYDEQMRHRAQDIVPQQRPQDDHLRRPPPDDYPRHRPQEIEHMRHRSQSGPISPQANGYPSQLPQGASQGHTPVSQPQRVTIPPPLPSPLHHHRAPPTGPPQPQRSINTPPHRTATPPHQPYAPSVRLSDPPHRTPSGPLHVGTPGYAAGPPSASPTSATYRATHGPSAPLRYGDDPFATIPGQEARPSYATMAGSPRGRPGETKQEHPPPSRHEPRHEPPREPPVPNGASASPSLRHLIH